MSKLKTNYTAKQLATMTVEALSLIVLQMQEKISSQSEELSKQRGAINSHKLACSNRGLKYRQLQELDRELKSIQTEVEISLNKLSGLGFNQECSACLSRDYY